MGKAIKNMSEEKDIKKSPTFILLSINVGLYVITSIISKSVFLMDPGMMNLLGFSVYAIFTGRFYVILTSIFFHSSIAHIGSNMLFLLIYGASLEDSGFEREDIFTIYLVTGIVSTILSIPFLGNAVTLGASGAVFGLLGAIIGYEWNQGGETWKKMLFVGFFNFIMANSPNTNVFAHLIGIIAGILITKYPYILQSEYALEFKSHANH